MKKTLYAYYQAMRDDRIIISFHGAVSQQLIIDFGQLLAGSVEPDASMRARLMSVFVELTENIQRYSVEKEPCVQGQRGVGVILALMNGGALEIKAGNRANQSDAETLKARIDELTKVPADELRGLYRKQRRESSQRTEGSAGLGLIEIARRVEGNLTCDLEPLSAEESFVTLHARLPLSQEGA